MVAMLRQEGHWNLNDADAKAYGLAMGNAFRHLPIGVGQKYFDFAAFGIAVVTYEFPRLAISAQLKAGRQSPQPRGPAQVFQFRPSMYSGQAPPPPSPHAPRPASATDAGPPPSGMEPQGFVADGVDAPIGGL